MQMHMQQQQQQQLAATPPSATWWAKLFGMTPTSKTSSVSASITSSASMAEASLDNETETKAETDDAEVAETEMEPETENDTKTETETETETDSDCESGSGASCVVSLDPSSPMDSSANSKAFADAATGLCVVQQQVPLVSGAKAPLQETLTRATSNPVSTKTDNGANQISVMADEGRRAPKPARSGFCCCYVDADGRDVYCSAECAAQAAIEEIENAAATDARAVGVVCATSLADADCCCCYVDADGRDVYCSAECAAQAAIEEIENAAATDARAVGVVCATSLADADCCCCYVDADGRDVYCSAECAAQAAIEEIENAAATDARAVGVVCATSLADADCCCCYVDADGRDVYCSAECAVSTYLHGNVLEPAVEPEVRGYDEAFDRSKCDENAGMMAQMHKMHEQMTTMLMRIPSCVML
ncbi:hypothetical protein PINS_up006438 [Pythium insidiosum]|nr:hypothetical protein PINS_up006438 [Pythium insidiosum]